MSELKVRFIDDTYVEYYNTGKHDLAQIYLKSEADKVIAELKAREDVLVTDNRDLLEKVKKLENLLLENADHFKRNEAQIIENADKVVAEKDKEIEELQKQVHDYAQGLYVIQSRAEKEARRHKYKRCLANAEACMHKRWRPDEGFDYAKITRHMKKWLEIAEKFKDNEAK